MKKIIRQLAIEALSKEGEIYDVWTTITYEDRVYDIHYLNNQYHSWNAVNQKIYVYPVLLETRDEHELYIFDVNFYFHPYSKKLIQLNGDVKDVEILTGTSTDTEIVDDILNLAVLVQLYVDARDIWYNYEDTINTGLEESLRNFSINLATLVLKENK